MSGALVDAQERSRFELIVNGETAVVDYKLLSDGQIALNQTNVPKTLSGQGVGSPLAKGFFNAFRLSGRHAVVRCEFLRAWTARNPSMATSLKNNAARRRHPPFVMCPRDR